MKIRVEINEIGNKDTLKSVRKPKVKSLKRPIKLLNLCQY